MLSNKGRRSYTPQLFVHIQTEKENINLFLQLLGVASNMWENTISCRNNVWCHLISVKTTWQNSIVVKTKNKGWKLHFSIYQCIISRSCVSSFTENFFIRKSRGMPGLASPNVRVAQAVSNQYDHYFRSQSGVNSWSPSEGVNVVLNAAAIGSE